MPAALSIGQCAELACLLEATAPKVGNVHRGADFEDLSFTDFALSAVAIGPAMDRAAVAGVGLTALDSIRATRQLIASNTNLGIVLLLAPLAAVPRAAPLDSGVREVLRGLTTEDSRLVYEAIRLAQPGGLGTVQTMDVAGAPPPDLLAAMHAAADRDLIARQYAEDFSLLWREVVPALVGGPKRGWSLTETIIHTHITLIARYGDTLIARKCGAQTAAEISALAGAGLKRGGPGDESYYVFLEDFDFFLRNDGNRRNPGATADLVAAGLFAALRDELLQPPLD